MPLVISGENHWVSASDDILRYFSQACETIAVWLQNRMLSRPPSTHIHTTKVPATKGWKAGAFGLASLSIIGFLMFLGFEQKKH